jgi:pyroglutamyl-peptidase
MIGIPRILVTGFEPFGGSPMNPAALIAQRLAAEGVPGAVIRATVLPVVGGSAPGSARAVLEAVLSDFQADAAIHFGEAHTRSEFSVERVAINLRDYRIADNAGMCAEDTPVVDGAPAAHFTTLPVRAIIDAVRIAGIPAGISLSAGTYLCNEVMFHSLERSAATGWPAISGFIHVPQLVEQFEERPNEARPMSAHELMTASRAAIGAVIAHLRTMPRGTMPDRHRRRLG